MNIVTIWVVEFFSQFELLRLVTTFKVCPYEAFFFNLSYVTISIFEYWYYLIVWVLSYLDFLSFVIIWFFVTASVRELFCKIFFFTILSSNYVCHKKMLIKKTLKRFNKNHQKYWQFVFIIFLLCFFVRKKYFHKKSCCYRKNFVTLFYLYKKNDCLKLNF